MSEYIPRQKCYNGTECILRGYGFNINYLFTYRMYLMFQMLADIPDSFSRTPSQIKI
jgi:hypothetical protein